MRMPLPCAMSMRRLVGWESIRYELAQYIEKQVQARCFEVGEEEDCFSSYPPCTYGRSCVRCGIPVCTPLWNGMPGPFAVFALELEGCTPGYLGPGV